MENIIKNLGLDNFKKIVDEFNDKIMLLSKQEKMKVNSKLIKDLYNSIDIESDKQL